MNVTREELDQRISDALAAARAARARRKADELANARTWECARRKAPCNIKVVLYVHVQAGAASHICRGEETPLHQTSGPTSPRTETKA